MFHIFEHFSKQVYHKGIHVWYIMYFLNIFKEERERKKKNISKVHFNFFFSYISQTEFSERHCEIPD